MESEFQNKTNLEKNRNKRKIQDDQEEITFKKRIYEKYFCNTSDENFLGKCNLKQIDYYESLNLDFKNCKNFTNNFVLKINKKVNEVVKQIRKYSNVNEIHINNPVYEVLTLIKNARYTLSNELTKNKYDKILEKKYEFKKKMFASYQMDDIFIIQDKLQNTLVFVTDKLNTFVVQNFFPNIHNFLEEYIEQESKTFIVTRPTSMNRIQVEWTLFENEKTMTRSEIGDMIKSYFSKFGNIVLVYVCPLIKNKVIIEYDTLEAVKEALKINNDPLVRYKVKEFLLIKYYNSNLLKNIEEKINTLNKNITSLLDNQTNDIMME
ncbi:djbp [Oxyplax ochracea nucleopolyhedrovirus]|uniref:Djbp n=1 Tax=Oxyplax ochracea nucleopolyhedrovirus TaxID=2083176 RepID=A0A2L0WU55_9ABAC|nr:djbp [Oxyplax ochracea nucleopolyhedrovirus]AVA31183.1 djbp [Oxyplax ochracea nucleopolyhedrovirus]